MVEAVGSSSSLVFERPASRDNSSANSEKVEQARAQRKESVAETVGRQAQFSTTRAETLSRQADQLEERAQRKLEDEGLGRRLDVTV